MMRIALVLPMLALGLLAPDNGRPESLNDQPQADLVLRGTVRDQSGLPVPRALVYIDGTQLSTDTDITGGFELALDPPRAGTLIVFRDGFSAVAVAFDPLALESSQIVLLAAPVRTPSP